MSNLKEDKLQKYLLNNCNSWEELEQEKYNDAVNLLRDYQNLADEEKRDMSLRGEYLRWADLYQKALESGFYPRAAAVSTVKRNIVRLLKGKDLRNLIAGSHNYLPGGGKFSSDFIKEFGNVLGDESELLQMTYENLRERLYEYAGLECVPLEEWKELDSKFGRTDEETERLNMAGLCYSNGNIVAYDNISLEDLDNEVKGYAVNRLKSNVKSR